MASKAYIEALKEIPKDIQSDVIGSINIANEIHFVLKQKGMTPADLARSLNKSESEISKWLTGLHNFTFKTVRKISDVLDTDLVVPNSVKIAEYERKLEKANKKIKQLQNKVERLNKKLNTDIEFNEALNITFSVGNEYYNFTPHGYVDKVKIKAQTRSTLSYHLQSQNDC